jgi:dihydroorotate dehydrogenase (fumarate)
MADLSVNYLGLDLKNPLVPSASPLTRSLDSAKHLEDNGAAAVVMYSLYEEQIVAEEHRYDRFLEHQALGHGEASSFLPEHPAHKSSLEQYLDQLHGLKQSLEIPVIASLNGTTEAGWIDFATLIEEAGADALELNIYYVAGNPAESAAAIEQRYVDVLKHLSDKVRIPIAVKLSSQFTSPLHMVGQLQQAGAAGVVIFNRFYQSDINLEELMVEPHLELSKRYESLLRIRWAAMIRGNFDVDLALTGGFHDSDDMIKGLLAGANSIQLASVLLQNGPERLADLLSEMNDWLDEHEYESVRQMAGSMAINRTNDPSAYERHDYLAVLDSFKPPPGVRY